MTERDDFELAFIASMLMVGAIATAAVLGWLG